MLRDIWATVVSTLAAPLQMILGLIAVICGIAMVGTFCISFLGTHPWMTIRAITLPLLVALIVVNVLRVVLAHIVGRIAGVRAN